MAEVEGEEQDLVAGDVDEAGTIEVKIPATIMRKAKDHHEEGEEDVSPTQDVTSPRFSVITVKNMVTMLLNVGLQKAE
ncbi:hypothetical protein V2J09_012738 [Rumex salicifolius]